MKKNRHANGFSFIEVMLSLAVLGIALAGAIAGWMYVLRGERITSIQNELDINVRQAMEKVRSDLRLSSVDKMYFYPSGVGPYTAISFPMARDDDGDGMVELDSNTNIIWDKTVIYHVWNTSPNQLRITTFDPRDNSLTPAQCQAQLDSVVAVGNGSATYGAANARTRAIFENLFTWSIRAKNAQYDCYSSISSRDILAPMGSVVLSAGNHDFKFTVVGKNTASSGYKIGIDSLVASPCGISREAEVQTVSAQSGASAAAEYMTSGTWDNNYQLAFPATAINQYFTLSINNDQWEETTFRTGAGLSNENTDVFFNDTMSPKDIVARLIPPTNAWMATWQTLDDAPENTGDNRLQGAAVRILLRGQDMREGGAIKYEGPFHCMWFWAGAQKLRIKNVYIARCNNPEEYSMDSVAPGVAVNFVGGTPDYTIDAGSSARVEMPTNSFYFDGTNSFLVSFLVDNVSGQCDARYWTELHVPTTGSPPPGCWIIPGSATPDAAATMAATWSSNPNVIQTNVLFALEKVHIYAASNGYYRSPIMDTHLSAPTYSTMTWNADKPSGTTLKMKVRTGNTLTNEDLADALAWSNVTEMTSGGTIAPASKRYVQFQAEMGSSYGGAYVPSLKDVTIKWGGQSMLTDVAATITKGPAYGIFELVVDGIPLKKGITIDLTIYEDVRGWHGVSNRLTSTVSAEVEPRNTGK